MFIYCILHYNYFNYDSAIAPPTTNLLEEVRQVKRRRDEEEERWKEKEKRNLRVCSARASERARTALMPCPSPRRTYLPPLPTPAPVSPPVSSSPHSTRPKKTMICCCLNIKWYCCSKGRVGEGWVKALPGLEGERAPVRYGKERIDAAAVGLW